jgi:hypothetical protein
VEGVEGVRTEAHQRYGNTKDYPGVTTIIGKVINKPALVNWANNLGLKGIDNKLYLQERGEVGTLTHEMILHHFKGTRIDTDDFSANQIRQAEKSYGFFLNWEEAYQVEPVAVECQLVHPTLRFGGTLDLIAHLTYGGQRFLELIDFKTGSGPWPEHFIQIAAYWNLALVNGYKLDNSRLLKLGNHKSNTFQEHQFLHLDKYWDVFLHCLSIYRSGVL